MCISGVTWTRWFSTDCLLNFQVGNRVCTILLCSHLCHQIPSYPVGATVSWWPFLLTSLGLDASGPMVTGPNALSHAIFQVCPSKCMQVMRQLSDILTSPFMHSTCFSSAESSQATSLSFSYVVSCGSAIHVLFGLSFRFYALGSYWSYSFLLLNSQHYHWEAQW